MRYGCGQRLIGANFLLKEDNDPKHTYKLCKNYFGKKQSAGILCVMEWPVQSPDLNPIQLLWEQLDCMVCKKCPSSQSSLWEVLQEAWGEISSDYLNKLTARMPKVCKAVIAEFFDESKVWRTKWLFQIKIIISNLVNVLTIFYINFATHLMNKSVNRHLLNTTWEINISKQTDRREMDFIGDLIKGRFFWAKDNLDLDWILSDIGLSMFLTWGNKIEYLMSTYSSDPSPTGAACACPSMLVLRDRGSLCLS